MNNNNPANRQINMAGIILSCQKEDSIPDSIRSVFVDMAVPLKKIPWG
jgi:hypothetical protein